MFQNIKSQSISTLTFHLYLSHLKHLKVSANKLSLFFRKINRRRSFFYFCIVFLPFSPKHRKSANLLKFALFSICYFADKSILKCSNFFVSEQFYITFCGFPFSHALTFSNAICARFTIASFEANATCGVTKIFFA